MAKYLLFLFLLFLGKTRGGTCSNRYLKCIIKPQYLKQCGIDIKNKEGTDQWVRIDRPETFPSVCKHLIYDKTRKSPKGKDGLFNK